MRKLYLLTMCFFNIAYLKAQISIYSSTSNNSSVTILPNAILSQKSAPAIDTSNTAIGINSLRNVSLGTSTSHGKNNTAFGNNVLNKNTTGYNNTAIGLKAGFSITTGYNNTALGANALSSLATHHNNTALGYNSLRNSIGNLNTAIGSYAMSSNNTGQSNTAVGYYALGNNGTGMLNVAVGANCLGFNNTGNHNVVVGYAGLQNLQSGNGNVALGYNANYWNQSGHNNIAIGYEAMLNMGNGSQNIAIGYNADIASGGLSNSIAIGAGAFSDASNKIRLGSISITSAEVQVPWTVTSDRRYKENIKPISLGLDFINQLQPVSYTRIADESEKQEFGLIAQDLANTLQKIGLNEKDLGMVSTDSKGYYAIRYNDLIPILIKAIQEQQVQIEQLKKQSK